MRLNRSAPDQIGSHQVGRIGRLIEVGKIHYGAAMLREWGDQVGECRRQNDQCNQPDTRNG